MSTPTGSPVYLTTMEGEVVTVTTFKEAPSSPTPTTSRTLMPPPAEPLRRRKPIRRNKRTPYWSYLTHSREIRTRLLRYTPEDVGEIDCPNMLDTIFRIYFYKFSKPRSTAEWLYCTAMIHALASKCQ